MQKQQPHNCWLRWNKTWVLLCTAECLWHHIWFTLLSCNLLIFKNHTIWNKRNKCIFFTWQRRRGGGSSEKQEDQHSLHLWAGNFRVRRNKDVSVSLRRSLVPLVERLFYTRTCLPGEGVQEEELRRRSRGFHLSHMFMTHFPASRLFLSYVVWLPHFLAPLLPHWITAPPFSQLAPFYSIRRFFTNSFHSFHPVFLPLMFILFSSPSPPSAFLVFSSFSPFCFSCPHPTFLSLPLSCLSFILLLLSHYASHSSFFPQSCSSSHFSFSSVFWRCVKLQTDKIGFNVALYSPL